MPNNTYLESQTPENFFANFAIVTQAFFIYGYFNKIWEDFVRNLRQD